MGSNYFRNEDGSYRPYGMMLSLDLFQCNVDLFNREDIEDFFDQLCEFTDMEPCELHFWDDLETPEEEKQTLPHTVGTSAVQFILTSNMVIHTLDKLQTVYLDCFTCKPFNPESAAEFCNKWFEAKHGRAVFMERLSEGQLTSLSDRVDKDLKVWSW